MSMDVQAATPSGRHQVTVRGHDGPRFDEVVTPEALDFLRQLHRKFTARRNALVDARVLRNPSGGLGFLSTTRAIREDETWRVAPAPPALRDRRVEITGPLDPKSAINGLNSGSNIWIADFEDSTSPTWHNIINGHLVIADAITGDLQWDSPEGKHYSLNDETATIVVRPRGWHLLERHILVDAEPVPASLVDFGLFFFHHAKELAAAGQGPFVYIPKLESHLEARLWNDIFVYAQEQLGLPLGTIRATVLIETITAAFEMEEILYELRHHVCGLNAGRWDYVFSIIKEFGEDPAFVLPDRRDIAMELPFMKAYTDLLVKTAHRRGAYAIGAPTAVSPSAEGAVELVRGDKDREAEDGFDGTLIAHPNLVETCREAFTDNGRTNKLDNLRYDVDVSVADLLSIEQAPGDVTFDGVRDNVAAVVQYLHTWLGGQGSVGWAGRPEDASTAEISRSQLWQWIRHGTVMSDGRPVTRDLVRGLVEDELEQVEKDTPQGSLSYRDAIADIVTYGALSASLPTSITEYAYRKYLV